MKEETMMMSGSRQIRIIFINSTPLFPENILHTFLGGFFFDLRVKGWYILDSMIYGLMVIYIKYEIMRTVT